MNEDVHWIISNQERSEFLKLSTDQQRDEFVVAFWNNHNPVGAPENSFKSEHYRRLAYANQHFAANRPGWETDRGHVYVVYGPMARPTTPAILTRFGIIDMWRARIRE
ncbi:MAG TPA: GWxTD domain-containing protein [Terriglobales bacterium]